MYILILLIVLIIILSTKNIEGYDVLYKNSSFENCAKRCKETAGCYGLGHDNKNNKC